MDAAGMAARDEIHGIAERTADELHDAFARNGFAFAVVAEPPVYGRAYVSIELRVDEAARLIDRLTAWAQ